jgi:hypothetical protein
MYPLGMKKMIVTEIDDQCLNCKAHSYQKAAITMDAYYSHPEWHDCAYSFDCPFREGEEDDDYTG